MIENIKNLYTEIQDKTAFLLMASKDLKRSPKTLRNHWFSNTGFWSIPEEKQARVVELLQNTIAKQNETKEIEVNDEEVK